MPEKDPNNWLAANYALPLIAGGEPWWCGFDFRNWSTDSIADLIVPIGACVLVSALSWVWF